MRWPEFDITESFEAMEKRLKITKETNDVRRTSLGAYPSASFYSQKEPKVNLNHSRARFDRIADRY